MGVIRETRTLEVPDSGDAGEASAPSLPIEEDPQSADGVTVTGAESDEKGGANMRESAGRKKRLRRLGRFLDERLPTPMAKAAAGAFTIAVSTAIGWGVDRVLNSTFPPSAGDAATRSKPAPRRPPRPHRRFQGRVLAEPTFAFAHAAPNARHTAEFTRGEAIAFRGFCLGPATRALGRPGTDERWLILADRELVQASQVAGVSTSGAAVACPGESGTGGPRLQSATTSRRGSRELAVAHFADASIVGFAVYEAGRWKPVAQRVGAHTRVSVSIDGDPPVMAAACWALGVPARASSAGNFVARVVGTSPAKAMSKATEATPLGATVACTPPTVGVAAPRRTATPKMPRAVAPGTNTTSTVSTTPSGSAQEPAGREQAAAPVPVEEHH